MPTSPSSDLLIYLGANAHKELVHQLLEINHRIRFVESAVYPEQRQSQFDDKLSRESVIEFDADLVREPGEIRFTPVNGLNNRKIIEAVMSDKLLPLLWSRSNKQTRKNNQSEIKRYEVTYSLIKSALRACEELKPEAVLFSYEPHMLPMYLFKKVCIALEIKILTRVLSPFIWRMFLEVEDGHGLGFIQPKKMNESIGESVKKFIEEKKSEYTLAKPFYEKSARGGMVNHFTQILEANGYNPYKIILRQLAFSNYRKLTVKRDRLNDTRYISVFLQYQPEQTTLPDGGLFVHQLIAIQMLYSAVEPLGISLVVREHPSTFKHVFNPDWRPKDYHSSIQEIGPNIYFDDLDADPYVLLKNSIGVAAITGSVLLEGLLQGRPVIAFGKHTLKGYSGAELVANFLDEMELREKIEKALAQSPDAITAEVEGYLHAVYPRTFGPSEYVGNDKMSLDKLREDCYAALRQVVQFMREEDISRETIITNG
jgi:hypothetical protein